MSVRKKMSKAARAYVTELSKCTECGRLSPGHSVTCKIGNNAALEYQSKLGSKRRSAAELEAVWPRIGPAIHRVDVWRRGKQKGFAEWEVEERQVRVMALVEGYAMVRRKGCRPYVTEIKDLFPL